MSLVCALMCASFAGSVSSIALPDAAARETFFVAQAVRAGPDAEFPDFAAEMGRALQAQGLKPAAAEAEASLVVRLSYVVRTQQREVADEPGRIGAQGTISAGGRSGGGGGGDFESDDEDRGATRIAKAYQASLLITAYEPAGKPVWQVRVMTTGPEKNLTNLVPAMIAMSQLYLGKTAAPTDVKLDDRDPALALVKGRR